MALAGEPPGCAQSALAWGAGSVTFRSAMVGSVSSCCSNASTGIRSPGRRFLFLLPPPQAASAASAISDTVILANFITWSPTRRDQPAGCQARNQVEPQTGFQSGPRAGFQPGRCWSAAAWNSFAPPAPAGRGPPPPAPQPPQTGRAPAQAGRNPD